MAKKVTTTTGELSPVVFTVTEELKNLIPSLSRFPNDTTIEFISKENHDDIISGLNVISDNKDGIIQELELELSKEVKENEFLETELRESKKLVETYEKDLEEMSEKPEVDENSDIPEIGIYEGKKYTKQEIIGDKKLLKLFKN